MPTFFALCQAWGNPLYIFLYDTNIIHMAGIISYEIVCRITMISS